MPINAFTKAKRYRELCERCRSIDNAPVALVADANDVYRTQCRSYRCLLPKSAQPLSILPFSVAVLSPVYE